MVISIEQNDGFLSITASGGQTDLDFDFPIYEKAHLRILRTRSGTTTTLALNTDYTIADGELEQEAGGTAVLTSGATAGDIYTLLLDVPEERTTDFNQAGDFLAATLNRELDLQTQQIQQLRRDVDKSATLPDTSTLTSLELPTPQASNLIGWNELADGMSNYVPADLDLAAIPVTAGVLVQTSAGVFQTRTITGTSKQITVTNGDGVGGNPTISLAASTYGFSARSSTGTSCANGVYTKVGFNVEDFDPNGDFDSVTNSRYTAPVTGYYQVNLTINLTSVANDKVIAAAIYKNGSIFKQNISAQNGAGTSISNTLSCLMLLSAGDYIEPYLFNGDASSRTVGTNTYDNHFSAYLTTV